MFLAISNGGKVFLIILLIVVLGCGGYLAYYFIHRTRNNERIIRNLTKEKDKLIKKEINDKLTRIEYIGKNNLAFYDAYENLKNEYDVLVSSIVSDFNVLFNHAKKELDKRAYKDFNTSVSELEKTLEEYKIKITNFENKVDLVIKDDQVLGDAQIDLQSRLNNLYQLVFQHSDDVQYIKNQLHEHLDLVKHQLEIFSDYFNKGNYVDAKELMMQIKDRIVFLEANMDKEIRYSSILTRQLPDEINKVVNKYNQMIQDGFPIKHINLALVINQNTIVLKDLISKLKNIDLDGFDVRIRNIKEAINDCAVKMRMEEEAKRFFEENNQKIYDYSLNLERDYIKYIKESKEVSTEFESTVERQRLEHTIKTEVQKLSFARRDLDALNYGKQPYTLRMEKIHELKAQADIVQQYIKESSDSIDDMKNISAYAKELIEQKAVIIRNLELEALNTKLDKIILSYEDEFSKSYRLIDTINELISQTPIDVDTVRANCKLLEESSEYLRIRVDNDVKQSFIAEQLIKVCNNFRPLDPNVARELSKAEIYFYDGKYQQCIDILKASLGDFDYKEYVRADNRNEILG